ncbi:MAG: dTMP kinase [Gammaproteobacteria bacterium]|jgi:dTMP kinase|nr:dTMP kinase [Gammaproteobacteria bacterium]
MRRGRFITVEGIEGVGKSTNVGFICERIGAAGYAVVSTREPGGTPLAEDIRDLVLAEREEAVPPAAELLLMFAARAVHLENLVRPALERGDWVVCDRFTDATLAYQGYGRGQDVERIRQLADIVHPDLRPDLTLLLDAPLAVSRQRSRDRGVSDRFENERGAFFERVRAGYLALAEAEPARFAVLDASRPLQAVQREIGRCLDRVID